ncbi:MAG: helix-turn-helix transcriptional regulator [Deltaproteobacteria bacterium]|nr:helix-turn-helix transcriptional regulator [Deltaproteobacteria bacterium]
MAEEKNHVDRIILKLGEKIKTLRTEKGWSLQDLAQKSGISAAGIHKIESNGIIPTITTMMKIADALGKKVSYFIEEGEKDAIFVPARDRKAIFTFKKGLDLQGISAKKYGDFIMTAAYSVVEVGASSGRKPMSHTGEELVYCIQGKMEFRVKDKTYILNPGDSLHFRTHLEHSWKNVGEVQAKLIWVLAVPPS